MRYRAFYERHPYWPIAVAGAAGVVAVVAIGIAVYEGSLVSHQSQASIPPPTIKVVTRRIPAAAPAVAPGLQDTVGANNDGFPVYRPVALPPPATVYSPGSDYSNYYSPSPSYSGATTGAPVGNSGSGSANGGGGTGASSQVSSTSGSPATLGHPVGTGTVGSVGHPAGVPVSAIGHPVGTGTAGSVGYPAGVPVTAIGHPVGTGAPGSVGYPAGIPIGH